MKCKAQVISTASPQLLAMHWQKSRAYSPLNERTRRVWLQAAWLHPSEHAGLELRWSGPHLGISNSRPSRLARP